MVDVFNPEGAFIGKVSLNIFHSNTPQSALIKSDLLYYTTEKNSGYKQFSVNRIKW